MSKVIFVNVENITFTFYCQSASTRYGFKHVVEMYNGGYYINTGKCYYLNRTWERWTYQSACIQTVNNELERIYNDVKTGYKSEHNIKRITEKHKKAIDEIYENMAGALLKLKHELNTNIY